MTDLSVEFLSIATAARSLAERADGLDAAALLALEEAATEAGKSWSKSNLGYQANVYYRDFRTPPPGHEFSREWGFLGSFHGTVGDWKTYSADEVEARIKQSAGSPNLDASREAAEAIRGEVAGLIDRARSISARIQPPHDDYLTENLEALQKISLPTARQIAASLTRRINGQFPVRDMQAFEGGWQVAGHQMVLAEVLHTRSPYLTARKVAEVCGRLGQHLEAINTGVEAVLMQLGSKVFIGHGGMSKEYLQLGVWLTNEGLEWEVFDREPTAGLSTKERLSEMLDNAAIAFLLMTAEDETSDGKMRARENVVHEVGLFQGRLGFSKAIVLVEDGCERFSNISGIGQIRFPKGDIRPAFDEIRGILRREGLLT
ncbi:TIR domain-containing protein [Streptomyces sp. NPDC001568]|uniref:TIR domain-containing protein n=1 Tax=Streptomyces sp. NPDC001568 TaxID=3364588 RepID=UPI00368876A3